MTTQPMTEIEAANAILRQTVAGSGVVRHQPMSIDALFGTAADGRIIQLEYGPAGELGFQRAVREGWLRVCQALHMITIAGRSHLISTGA